MRWLKLGGYEWTFLSWFSWRDRHQKHPWMGISLAASHTAICLKPICQPFNPHILSSRQSQATCRKEYHKISWASCLHQWLSRNRNRWFWCCCWSPEGYSPALCLGVLRSSCGNSTAPRLSAWISVWPLLRLACAHGKSSRSYADWPSPHIPSRQWFTVKKDNRKWEFQESKNYY